MTGSQSPRLYPLPSHVLRRDAAQPERKRSSRPPCCRTMQNEMRWRGRVGFSRMAKQRAESVNEAPTATESTVDAKSTVDNSPPGSYCSGDRIHLGIWLFARPISCRTKWSGHNLRVRCCAAHQGRRTALHLPQKMRIMSRLPLQWAC
ncbi:hypothetical protein FH972_022853 [Carpinus fangiana]|uniref:Uncharacterized protein n=1 Tax=Carpinus fangiana TaxID=176857 RepID=A0A5N6KTY9_9ROSI|nr:hypothetical protein FH972_022853 [Carpinus fangiana]